MKVLLPIEHKTREIDGRVWLALNLIRKGHSVVISEWPTNIDNIDLIKPDILFKNACTNDRKETIKKFHKNGGHVVVQHSEGAIYSDDNLHYSRFDENMFPYIAKFFEWGMVQKNLVENNLDIDHSKVISSGAPRFDLLSKDLRDFYRPKSEEYLNEFGDYILINTNFVHANPVNEELKERSANEKRIEDFNAYLVMINELSDRFDKNIIIRPHPIEDLNQYIELFDNNNNVHPIKSGDVRPWILGAQAVIHSSSTSGVESVMLGKRTYSYLPNGLRSYHSILPVKASIQVNEPSTLINYLNSDRKHLNQEENQHKHTLSEYFSNFNGALATDIICEEINGLDAPNHINFNFMSHNLKKNTKRLAWKYLGTDFVDKVGMLYPNFDQNYYRERMPKLTKKELIRKFDRLNNISNILNCDISIEEHSTLPNTFYIY